MNNTFCKNCHRIPSQCCCAPAKTLTDEEIEQIFKDETGFVLDESPIALIDFARAILKKASER